MRDWPPRPEHSPPTGWHMRAHCVPSCAGSDRGQFLTVPLPRPHPRRSPHQPCPRQPITAPDNPLTGRVMANLLIKDEAATLVLTLPGYRAALLASVAACCASHAALLT